MEDLTTGHRNSLHVFSIPTGATGGAPVCGWAMLVIDAYACQNTIFAATSTGAFYRAAYSPLGDRVWVAINHTRRAFTSHTDMVPCEGTDFLDGLPLNLCREFRFERGSAGVDVYSIGVPDGTATLLWNDPSAAVFWLGVSEGGLEEVAGLGLEMRTGHIRYVPNPDSTEWRAQNRGGGGGISNCRYQFRVVATGQVEQIPSATVCSADTGPGTFATPPPPPIASGKRSPARVPWRPRRSRR